MDKCFQTKALCDRIATLLFHCSAGEYKKRVDFLHGVCNDWVSADCESAQSSSVHHLHSTADSAINSKFCSSTVFLCHDDTPESSEDFINGERINAEKHHSAVGSNSQIMSDLSCGKAWSSLQLNTYPVCGKRSHLASRRATLEAVHEGVTNSLNERPYVCYLCSKRFMKKISFTNHFYSHDMHNERGKRSVFCCTICRWSSANFNELGEHVIMEHGGTRFKLERVASDVVELGASGSPDAEEDPDNSINFSDSSDDFIKSVAENCNSGGENISHRIANQSVIKDANKKGRTRNASRNRSTVKKSVGRKHPSQDSSSLIHKWQMKYPDRKIVPHTCSICGKQFLQAVQLRKHMINHAEEVTSLTSGDLSSMPPLEFPYSCCVCRRHFLFANDLRRHLVSHSDERPHSCVVCQRAFKREDDLAKHMKTHRNVRPYECEICGERLETATKVRKHVRRMHGNRYECTICRQYFTKRSALSRHKREHHPDINRLNSVSEATDAPLPYMCDRCGKSFSFESDLRNHIYGSHSRRRSPVHACRWCHRQFSSTSHLASHERTHTGDRPYTCDTCGKQFTQSGSLNVHRRTHVEPQPFACDICDQKFASKQYAKKHLAMRHGISSVGFPNSSGMTTVAS